MLSALAAYRFLLGIGIGGEYPAGSVGCSESTGELESGTRNRWFIWFTNLAIDAGFVVAAFVPMVVVLNLVSPLRLALADSVHRFLLLAMTTFAPPGASCLVSVSFLLSLCSTCDISCKSLKPTRGTQWPSAKPLGCSSWRSIGSAC